MPGTTEFLQVIALAVDRAATGIAIVRQDATIAYANASAKRLLGREGADLSGASLLALEPGLDAETWRARWARMSAGEVLAGPRLAAAGGGQVALDTTAMVVEVAGNAYCVTTLREAPRACPACGAPRP
jgi:PAS domain-containing protein